MVTVGCMRDSIRQKYIPLVYIIPFNNDRKQVYVPLRALRVSVELLVRFLGGIEKTGEMKP
jgi:hypothetical protein